MRHGGDDLNRIPVPAIERDRISLALRKRGWTYKRIAKHVGLSENGVSYSLIQDRRWQTRPTPTQLIL